MHALLGALEQYETVTRFEVRFGDAPESTAEHIRAAQAEGARALLLWSFYSPDAAAPAAELVRLREPADGSDVRFMSRVGCVPPPSRYLVVTRSPH